MFYWLVLWVDFETFIFVEFIFNRRLNARERGCFIANFYVGIFHICYIVLFIFIILAMVYIFCVVRKLFIIRLPSWYVYSPYDWTCLIIGIIIIALAWINSHANGCCTLAFWYLVEVWRFLFFIIWKIEEVCYWLSSWRCRNCSYFRVIDFLFVCYFVYYSNIIFDFCLYLLARNCSSRWLR